MFPTLISSYHKLAWFMRDSDVVLGNYFISGSAIPLMSQFMSVFLLVRKSAVLKNSYIALPPSTLAASLLFICSSPPNRATGTVIMSIDMCPTPRKFVVCRNM